MAHRTISTVCLILFVSINLCWTQTVTKTNIKFGTRKNGDSLLASETKVFTWNVPQNVQKEVTYQSKGPKITQLDFYVETNGNTPVTGKLISGGQGQKNVAVLLEATSITTMKYTVNVYGNSAALMPSIGLIASFIIYTIYANKL